MCDKCKVSHVSVSEAVRLAIVELHAMARLRVNRPSVDVRSVVQGKLATQDAFESTHR